MHTRAPLLRVTLPLLLISLINFNALAASDEQPDDPLKLLNSRVNVELKSGKIMRNVLVAEATSGETAGAIVKLRVVNMTTRSQSVLGASAIERVTTVDGAERLVYDEDSKSLIPPDPQQREGARKADAKRKAEEAANTEEPEAAQEKPKAEDEEPVRPRLTEKERTEYHKQHGVWLWPELSDEEQKKEIAKQRDYVRKVQQKLGPKLHLRETDHFLFLTDLPTSTVKPWTDNLDEMYVQLCKAFNINGRYRDRLWLGKVMIVAFEKSEDFKAFERQFFNIPDTGAAQGLSHMLSSGDVLISGFFGNDSNYFASLLVHETTHGFMHRYRAYRALPNWLDEGIAEWISLNVVKNNHGVKRKMEQAKARMRRDKNLGGNFYTTDHIHGEQYGMATLIVGYLLQKNREALHELIDDIKAGTDWHEALKKAYGVTTDELTQQFGESIGIPDLKP